MLVLSRKVGQRIVIAGNIDITVIKIHGNKIVLGVTAESHVSVHRVDARNQPANKGESP